MRVNGESYRSIWLDPQLPITNVIDQTQLPFKFTTKTLLSVFEAKAAIRDMVVRGAPLIGATAACGMFLAANSDPSDKNLIDASNELLSARPTAVNLRWAIEQILPKLLSTSHDNRIHKSRLLAQTICDNDVAINSSIGDHGLAVITEYARKKENKTINILTHCNAGWLATVDWGTALSPIFKAFNNKISVHVWVDETRPRNQGASLTAWELNAHGIDHTVISDNAGGHLMQSGNVDLCIVGADRTTRTGDVCNKIGTYLKALAAADTNIPFYAAVPSSTIDWNISDGLKQIPIENRSEEEVSHMQGLDSNNRINKIRVIPQGSKAANPAFDVTPAHLISGIITERGVTQANEKNLLELFNKHP